MPVYKFTDGRKGWYFQGYFEGKKYKKENWKKQKMLTKNDALIAEREFLDEKKNEKDKLSGQLSLYELYDEYVKTSKSSLKASTLNTYDKFKRNQLTLIEDKNIFSYNVQDFLEWRKKICSSTSLSENYKNRMLKLMICCLSYGNLMYNLPGKLQFSLLEPYKDNSKIEKVETKSEYIKINDFEYLLSFLKKNDMNQIYYYTILYVLYFTGIRIGELAALTINDYDGNCLSITKNYIKVNGIEYIQSPKSKNSIRTVSLDANTIDIINKYLEIFNPTDIMFKLKGNYLNQQRLRRVMKELGEKSGLINKYDLHPHALRHSHSSILHEMNIDEYQIAKRLGHTAQVSASTYIHVNDDINLENMPKISKKL